MAELASLWRVRCSVCGADSRDPPYVYNGCACTGNFVERVEVLDLFFVRYVVIVSCTKTTRERSRTHLKHTHGERAISVQQLFSCAKETTERARSSSEMTTNSRTDYNARQTNIFRAAPKYTV